MSVLPTDRAELNGSTATAQALRVLALVNYGHFSSLQVQDGCARGLDLHLQRLAAATQELFGHALDVAQTRRWMRQIVEGAEGALSLRVNVFSRSFDRDRPIRSAPPDVLITTAAARVMAPAPLRVGSVRYQRELPHIKHVGTFGLFHQKRLAQALGFDDALFVDPGAAIAEGSIWNIGFLDQTGVVWPDAPALRGISMQLLQRGLREHGIGSATRRIGLDELACFRGAFFTNASCAVLPIACIDAVDFAVDADAIAMLERCYATNPPQPI